MKNSTKLPLEQLLSLWNKEDINYCVWKGLDKIATSIQGDDDLDILVSLEDSIKAESIAKSLGFINLLSEEYRRDVGTKDYYNYSIIHQRWYHLHIHYQLIFGNGVIRNYHLPIEKQILSSRIWDEDNKLWSISHGDDICLFLIRHILRKNIYGTYINFQSEYTELLNFHKNHIITPSSQLYPEPVLDYINQTIKGNKPSIDGLRKQLLVDLYPNKQKKSFATIFRLEKKIRIRLIKLWTKKPLSFGNSYLPKGGVLIAFVGIDGSGKSSAIERLSAQLGSRINTEIISLGSGVSGASWYRRIAFGIFGTKAKFKGHKNSRSKNNNNSSKAYPWYYIVWLIICLWDKKRELRRGLAAKSRGSIVFSDRWLQVDISNALDGRRTENIKNDSFLKRYLKSLENKIFQYIERNKPDLVVRFDINPETSIIRKPNDLTIDRAGVAKEILESINWRVELKTIDANQSIKEVDSILGGIIINKLNLHSD